MKNQLTTPIAILIGSFMIAGTILYTSGNISNPIIRTANANSLYEIEMMKISIQTREILGKIRDILKETGSLTCLQTYSVEGTSFYTNLKKCKNISEEIRELE